MNSKSNVFNINYNEFISWSSGFTAPQDGIAEAMIEGGTTGYMSSLTVNGEIIPFCGRVSSGVSQYVAIIFLHKGDVLSYSSTSPVDYRRFYKASD